MPLSSIFHDIIQSKIVLSRPFLTVPFRISKCNLFLFLLVLNHFFAH